MHALEERGYLLAKGDRAAIVAVDINGETYSVPKMLPKEIKVRQVRARIGDEDDLPSMAKVKRQISQGMVQALDRFKVEADETLKAHTHAFEYRRNTLVQGQRIERQTLVQAQERRQLAEAHTRQRRFRAGLKGLWDRLRGEHARIRALNEKDAARSSLGDRNELEDLTFRHLYQRRKLDIYKLQTRREHTRQRVEIERDRERYLELPRQVSEQPARPARQRKRSRDHGPEP